MDLSTNYLGLELKNPVVPSASPLSKRSYNIRWMEDVGAGAIVMYSLFEEQIEAEASQLDHFLAYGSESSPEALSYYPDLQDYNVGPDEYLEKIRDAKNSVDIPIIGSLNGTSTGGWIEYARKIEEAGADALELNVYHIPTDVNQSSADVEKMYLDVVESVKSELSIPVAVKISPFFSSPANMAKRLGEAGASGVVLFNRFYQPDFDLDRLEVVPHLVLSQAHELMLPLRWTAILFGRVPVDFAITSGVHSSVDVLKCMMAGAKVAMMASELLEKGIGRIGEILEGASNWMEEHGYESVKQMQGSMSQRHVADPLAFERANYMKVLQSWRPDPTGQLT